MADNLPDLLRRAAAFAAPGQPLSVGLLAVAEATSTPHDTLRRWVYGQSQPTEWRRAAFVAALSAAYPDLDQKES